MIEGMEWMVALATFVGGLLLGWLFARNIYAATLTEREKAAAQQRTFFDTSLSKMESIFQGAARDALKDNKDAFLQNTQAKLQPLTDALNAFQGKADALEQKRATAYGELSQQIKGMLSASQRMQTSSESMQNLLKTSNQARGNWGEYLLQNIVEFAGMKEHVNFEVQVTLPDGSRPDMVINLPGGAGIPVDAKCPFASYAEAKEEADPERVNTLMKAHGDAVKGHVTDLIRKDYSEFTRGDFDCTVMFMPGDHLLSAALDEHPGLQDEALTKGILITSPVSLVALLRTVRIYWKHEDTNRNAQEIATAARSLYDRVETWMGHYGEVGESLAKAVKAYNRSQGSYQKRIAPAGRKMVELKVTQPKNKALDDDTDGPSQIEILPEE